MLAAAVFARRSIRRKVEEEKDRARVARVSFYGTGPSGLWRELESTTRQLTLDCEIVELWLQNPDLERQLVERVTAIRHRIKELTHEFRVLPASSAYSSVQNVLSELQRVSEAILYYMKSPRTDALESSLHESLIPRLHEVNTIVLRQLAGVSNGGGSRA